MRNPLAHILLVTVVALTPPGASMVEFTCDLTGATTQVINALAAGNHVDECCDGATDSDHTLATASRDCCRATAFSLPLTSPAPTHAVSTPALTWSTLPHPDAAAHRMPEYASRPVSTVPRNLPLLI